jgi:hypothetical protein
MASGKKNYFRHSNTAFDDEKIQKCIELLGYEGYAYYFILLEVLAKQCENSFKNPITIHTQSLRNVWRKQDKSCIKVVKKLEESGLFVATFRESFVDFYIPNLSKYMGKYETKIHSNSPNKRKEKEIKEKESKIKENKENTSAKSETSTSDVREVYKRSYYLRYGIYPVWSVKENSLAKKLVASIGLDEAKQLAEYYPNYRDRFHEQKKHPFALLVSQVDQVRVASNGRTALPDYGNPYTKKLKELERLEKLNEVKNV